MGGDRGGKRKKEREEHRATQGLVGSDFDLACVGEWGGASRVMFTTRNFLFERKKHGVEHTRAPSFSSWVGQRCCLSQTQSPSSSAS